MGDNESLLIIETWVIHIRRILLVVSHDTCRDQKLIKLIWFTMTPLHLFHQQTSTTKTSHSEQCDCALWNTRSLWRREAKPDLWHILYTLRHLWTRTASHREYILLARRRSRCFDVSSILLVIPRFDSASDNSLKENPPDGVPKNRLEKSSRMLDWRERERCHPSAPMEPCRCGSQRASEAIVGFEIRHTFNEYREKRV